MDFGVLIGIVELVLGYYFWDFEVSEFWDLESGNYNICSFKRKNMILISIF